MADYKGNTCPVCHEKFKEGDDIVVCPDCGTPYHRACWAKNGACVHETEHAAGFTWVPDNIPEDVMETTCPNCGTRNPSGAKFCNHCGVPLPSHPDAVPPKAEEHAPVYARPQNGAAGSSNAPHIDAYTADQTGVFRKELGPEDPIDGIKAKDWASYVGKSSIYYLMQFFRMSETKHKITVCFSAFFFGPLYFFYRKMWKEGALFTVLSLLLSLPSLITILALSDAPIVAALPLGWLQTGLTVCNLLDWAQMMLRGLLAVYWYKKDCATHIQTIYDTTHEGQERNDALALRGGTSVVAVVLFLVAYAVLTVLLTRLMGPNLQAVLSFVGM